MTLSKIQFNLDGLDQLLEQLRQEYEIPGLAVGLGTSAQGLLYEQAFGYKNQLTGEVLETRHIFHLCSVTKLFTGAAVLKLAEAGRLQLDQPYVELVPWFTMKSPRHKEMTVRQMLSHTSGMGDCDDYQWDQARTNPEALKEYACSEEVFQLPFVFAPGAGQFLYSNVAYELLGVLIEELTALTYDEYVRTALLQPLGMADSTLLTFTRNMAAVCAPHGRDGRGPLFVYEHFPYNRSHGPSSTLTSHLRDLARFAEAMLKQDERIFRYPETFSLVTRPVAVVPNNGEEIGLSWFLRQQEGVALQGHEGTDDGFRSSFWLCPDLDLYLMVLANVSRAPVKKISKAVLAQVLAKL